MTVCHSMYFLLKVLAKVVATCSIIVNAASAAGITARWWLQGCKPLQYFREKTLVGISWKESIRPNKRKCLNMGSTYSRSLIVSFIRPIYHKKTGRKSCNCAFRNILQQLGGKFWKSTSISAFTPIRSI